MKKQLVFVLSLICINSLTFAMEYNRNSDNQEKLSFNMSKGAPKKPSFINGSDFKRFLLEQPAKTLQGERKEEELLSMHKEFDYKEFDKDEMKEFFNDAPEEVQAKILAVKYPHCFGDMPVEELMLLYGPPGSGKTSLGKVVAHKLKRNLIFLSSSKLPTTFQDSGSVNLHSIMSRLLKRNKPLVVMLDEITALTENYQSEHSNRHNTALALIQVIDDCMEKKGIFLIGTANKINGLPPAIKSRFDLSMIKVGPLDSSKRLNAMQKFFAKDNVDMQIPQDDEIWQTVLEATTDFTHRDVNNFVSKVLRSALFSQKKSGQEYKNIRTIVVTKEAVEKSLEHLKMQEEEVGKIKEDPLSQQERFHKESLKHSVDLNRVMGHHDKYCLYNSEGSAYRCCFQRLGRPSDNELFCSAHYYLSYNQIELADSYNPQLKLNRRSIEKSIFKKRLDDYLKRIVNEKPVEPGKPMFVNLSNYGQQMEEYNNNLLVYEERLAQARTLVEHYKNEIDRDPDLYLKIKKGIIAFDSFDIHKD